MRRIIKISITLIAVLVLVGCNDNGISSDDDEVVDVFLREFRRGADNIGGTFTDSRDNQKYRTVVMPDGKTWMAENLNYRDPNWSNDGTGSVSVGARASWCYDNNSANCNIYGRLYTWEAARVACPAGWRLPTADDWENLIEAVGDWEVAGTRLKSSTGWDSDGWYDGNGTDNFGFSALPGGYRWDGGNFSSAGYFGGWWSATEDVADAAYFVRMFTDSSTVGEYWGYKSYGLSARCVRN